MWKKLLTSGAVLAVVASTGGVALASTPSAAPPTSGCDTSQLASRGYVTTGGRVAVVDTRTLSLSGNPIGGFVMPGYAYAMPDGRTVYVDDLGAQAVRAVDACSRTVTATIHTGFLATQGTLSWDGRYLYEYSLIGGSKVSVIDTSTNRIVRSIPVPASLSAAISPDGTRLYVAGFHALRTYDAATGRLLGTTPIGLGPVWTAVTPDGSKVFTADLDGTVSVIDTRTGTLAATVHLGATVAPLWVAVTPDGSQAWVTMGGGGVAVISTTTDKVTSVVPTDGMAIEVTFDAQGHDAFIGEGGPATKGNGLVVTLEATLNKWANTPAAIRVVDARTLQVLKVIQTPGMTANIGIPGSR